MCEPIQGPSTTTTGTPGTTTTTGSTSGTTTTTGTPGTTTTTGTPGTTTTTGTPGTTTTTGTPTPTSSSTSKTTTTTSIVNNKSVGKGPTSTGSGTAAGTTASSTQPVNNNFLNYVNPVKKISIKYPSTWTKTELAGNPSIPVIFNAPLTITAASWFLMQERRTKDSFVINVNPSAAKP